MELEESRERAVCQLPVPALFHRRLVCLFLKRGADYNARDKNEKDPITIAVDNANADIVTLLRIAKMNKEMREMDGSFGQSGHSKGHGSGGSVGVPAGGRGQARKSLQAIKNHISGWALGGQND